MDSNNTHFILIQGAHDFDTLSRDCGWNGEVFSLNRQDPPLLAVVADAQARWANATPYIQDDFAQVGRLSADRRSLEFSLDLKTWQVVRASIEGGMEDSAKELSLDPVDAPAGSTFSDLHIGGSGLVALPFNNGLLITHLRKRWQASCVLPFTPLRAWVDGNDQVWLVGDKQLGLCRGAPLPQAYYRQPDRFEPVNLNPDPLRLLWQQDLPEHTGITALAASDNILVILAGKQLFTRPLTNKATFKSYTLPDELPFISDICCLSDERILLLAPFSATGRDCAVFDLKRQKILAERWPRLSEREVRFVRHRDNQPRSLSDAGVVPLYRLAQARFPHQGSAVLSRVFDSGTPSTIWHRLYIEACIPHGCKLQIEAQTLEQARAKVEHWEMQHEPLWLPIASELPFASAALKPVPEQQGLFEVLLQRNDGSVRDLAGRYLRLKLTLSGDGRHSPAIYAIRAWYPRFSWQANFLPSHFHQQQEPQPGPANGADTRERLLACFEGLFTPIEERIVAAETLLYPDATPNLPWLAQFTGSELPAHWPEIRQRQWLSKQSDLQRLRGTYAGLVQALDIISDGGVRRGEVIPVELFRLRRTLSTILGINMDDEQHPLTLGTSQSGNSRVGESLILSDEQSREFLALFAPELASGTLEKQTVAHFFDQYARRVTIVLHGTARRQKRNIAAALPQLLPAVVQWNIVTSDHPFVLGLSPLLGIDTYLEPEPNFGRVQLNVSRLGRGHVIQNPVALGPEYVGAH